MDWTKCALCQSDSDGLNDPSKNRNSQVDSYSILASHIEVFLDHNNPLPSKITVPSSNLAGDINMAYQFETEPG